MPTTTPAFMSKTPGPEARPPSSRQGISARVPAGQTVSRWPSSSVPPSRKTTEARRASPRGAQGRSSARHPALAQAVVDPRRGPRDARGVLATGSRGARAPRGRRPGAAGPTRTPRASGATWATILALEPEVAVRVEAAVVSSGVPWLRRRRPRACPRRPTRGPASSASRPLRPVAELREAARAATPPAEPGPFRPVELVELTTLDPTLRLDVRYATADNFLGDARLRGGPGLPPAPRGRGAPAGAPRPAGEGVRPPGPRRLPAVVGHEGLLGRHPEGQARLRGRSREGLPPQPRLRRRPDALPPRRRRGRSRCRASTTR